jgi:hypothetical protein
VGSGVAESRAGSGTLSFKRVNFFLCSLTVFVKRASVNNILKILNELLGDFVGTGVESLCNRHREKRKYF